MFEAGLSLGYLALITGVQFLVAREDHLIPDSARDAARKLARIRRLSVWSVGVLGLHGSPHTIRFCH